MFKNLLSFALLAISVANAQIVNSVDTMTLTNANVSPDGFTRAGILVNGVHGPLIRGGKNDNFELNVVNDLDNPTMLRPTSIHWHGLFQRGTNWADGADGVNQCPISPGHAFLYKFTPAGHAGTFWYHSHFGTQYCDGLRGPMVIYDDNDPHAALYDEDDENTIITLADWYHIPAPSIQGAAQPDATLINGKGRYVGGPAAELSIVNVEQGKKYRMRLISLSCDPNWQFSIDGHELTIIEVDGQLTEPHTVDRLQIFTGQRYSFVLDANQPVDNYWIRAQPNKGRNGLAGTFANGVNSAILRYAGAANADPTTSANPNPAQLNEADLHALIDPAAPGIPTPGAADVNLRFQLGFSGGRFTINGTAYESPSVPTLLQIMSGAQSANDLLPAGSVYELPRNQVVELVVPAGVLGGPHPFHLHGHAFSVVRSAGSSTYNFVNPVKRDVVSLGVTGDEVTIRFVTDNPGPWFFHCHIEFHLMNGLAIVFAEDMANTVDANNPPVEWAQLCEIYDDLPPEATSIQTVVRRAEPTGFSAKFRREGL
uniref:Laccase 1 n=2 Tax=Coprinopsis cinerea TaxID=5346 RepID=Q08AC6_COPC7|nr:laccase 1 precursor [Coprinopsis cinerea]AAR01241.1 laccase 1 [Coprinopsis cinerea]DAA04506.1 TPA_exp: laccase 1 [Coprinopsis cinerea okayama7\